MRASELFLRVKARQALLALDGAHAEPLALVAVIQPGRDEELRRQVLGAADLAVREILTAYLRDSRIPPVVHEGRQQAWVGRALVDGVTPEVTRRLGEVDFVVAATGLVTPADTVPFSTLRQAAVAPELLQAHLG